MGNKMGQILGAETVKEAKMLVETVLSQAWQERFTTRDMRMMIVACLVTLLFMAATLIHYYSHKVSKNKLVWWRLPLNLTLSVLIFPALVLGQLYINNFFQYVRAPRSVQYSREVPQILSISYRTYDPTFSIVAWGYDPAHLDYLELGGAALNKVRKHEFNIPVQANSTIYFRIKSGAEFYGQNSQISGKVFEATVINREDKK